MQHKGPPDAIGTARSWRSGQSTSQEQAGQFYCSTLAAVLKIPSNTDAPARPSPKSNYTQICRGNLPCLFGRNPAVLQGKVIRRRESRFLAMVRAQHRLSFVIKVLRETETGPTNGIRPPQRGSISKMGFKDETPPHALGGNGCLAGQRREGATSGSSSCRSKTSVSSPNGAVEHRKTAPHMNRERLAAAIARLLALGRR